jgi:hypothetical protein
MYFLGIFLQPKEECWQQNLADYSTAMTHSLTDLQKEDQG